MASFGKMEKRLFSISKAPRSDAYLETVNEERNPLYCLQFCNLGLICAKELNGKPINAEIAGNVSITTSEPLNEVLNTEQNRQQIEPISEQSW
jgi:hypothetical protein